MSENWEAEYDKRQYELMAEHIRHFEEGASNLGSLVAGLDSLLEGLEAPEKGWKEQFRGEWWTIEQVYAVALDRGQTELSAEDEGLVNRAVGNMKHLLAERVPVPTDS